MVLQKIRWDKHKQCVIEHVKHKIILSEYRTTMLEKHVIIILVGRTFENVSFNNKWEREKNWLSGHHIAAQNKNID